MPEYVVTGPDGARYKVTSDREMTADEAAQAAGISASTPPEEGSTGRSALALGARIALPILGGITGGIPGAIAGGAAGELAGEYIEGEDLSPRKALVAGGLSAIPVGPFGRAAGKAATTAGRYGLRIAEGATQGVLGAGAQPILGEGRIPSASEVGTGAALGATFGGAFEAGADVVRKVRGKGITQTPDVPATAAPDAPPTSTPDVPPVADDVDGYSVDDVVQARTEPNTVPPDSTSAEAPTSPSPDTPSAPVGAATRPDLPPSKPSYPAQVQRHLDAIDRIYANESDEMRQAAKDVILSDPDRFEQTVRGRQTVKRTQALADREFYDGLEPQAPGTTHTAAQNKAFADLVATQHADVADAAALLRRTDLTPEQRASAQARVASGQKRFVNLILGRAGGASEAGRTLREQRELARVRPTTPEQRNAVFVRAAARAGLNPEQITNILAAHSDDPVAQMRALMSASRADIRENILLYVLNNYLLGPVTHERNIFGNVTRLAMEVPTKLAQAGVSKVMGKEQVYATEAWRGSLAATKSIPQAFKAFGQVIRRGFSDADLDTFVLEGKWDAPSRGPALRALQAADQFFKTLGLAMHTDSLAYRRAMQEVGPKSTNKAFEEAMARHRLAIALEPPDEIKDLVSRGLFQEKGKLSTTLNMALERHPWGGLAFRIAVMPFIKTTANISRQAIEFSPVGLLTKRFRDPETQQRAMAEIIAGSALLAPFAYAYANGQLTGAAPSRPGERDAFLSKHPEYSIHIPDYGWVSYMELPQGMAIAMTATFVDKFQKVGREPELDDVMDLVLRITAGAGNSFIDRSFTAGLGRIAEVIHSMRTGEGKALERWFHDLGTSLLPGQALTRQAVRVTDPEIRQPTNLKERVQNILPGESQKVRPKLNAFGETIQREPSGYSSLFLFAPIRKEQKEAEKPVRARLKTLGIYPAPLRPTDHITMKGERYELTPQQDLVIRQAQGRLRLQFLTDLFADPDFDTLDRKDQQKAVDTELKRAARVKQAALGEIADGKEITVEGLVN